MSRRKVLAIHEDTNANAAAVEGNRIVAAVAEERLTRRKYQPGFPARSVVEVLRQAGWTLEDLDGVVAGNRFHFLPRLFPNASPIEGEHDLFGVTHKSWLTLQALFAREGLLAKGTEQFNRWALKRRFGRVVDLVDHHTAHAWSAYLTSDFPEALAVSVDNVGDGFSARVFGCSQGRLEPLWESGAVESAGQFYGEISQYLGFHVLMAGKVTGLAARGNPALAYPVMEKLFSLTPDKRAFRLAPLWSKRRNHGLFESLKGMSREDISAAAQKRLEDVLVEYVAHALEATGHSNVVLAGGVFANVLVNHRLWQLPQVKGLFVHPAMSDQGIAVGAALGWNATQSPTLPTPIPDVYLGPSYDEESIGLALEESGLRYQRRGDRIFEDVSRLLAEGKVVARFDGRMEYGPRALGNRSILYNTKDPTVNDWLNHRLNRSEFMPFAPATLEEFAPQCYEGYGPGVAHSARFMTITFPCSETMRKQSPAVVHVDGTARPQIVSREYSPGFHRIIHRYHELTGIPSIINTSFNMHGEPIVCTPEDAIRSFSQGNLDVLAVGNFLVLQENS